MPPRLSAWWSASDSSRACASARAATAWRSSCPTAPRSPTCSPPWTLAPRSCVVAINREYADERAIVRAGDEVALVPPVSGGAGVVRSVRVTGEPLDLAALAAAVRDPAAGAVVLFEGVTREVAELDYEAYAEMAEPKLRAIGEEVAARLRPQRGRARAPHRHGAAGRAERHRRRLGAAPRRGLQRRPRADRPRQGGGADLEGRGRHRGRAHTSGRNPPAHAPAGLAATPTTPRPGGSAGRRARCGGCARSARGRRPGSWRSR